MSRFSPSFPSVHVYPPSNMYNAHHMKAHTPAPVHAPPLSYNPYYHQPFHRQMAVTKVTQKTIVIFDWDDTVFPTTSVVCKREQNITVGQLQLLGKSVYELFGKYIATFGANNVFIVTNGSSNWVLESLREMSRVYQVSFDGVDDQEERGKDYWAALFNSLLSLQLKIVSAKALYAEDHPQQPTLWKTLVFKSIVKEHFNLYSGSDNNIYCIISIGDSQNEFKASFEAKQMITTMNQLNRNNNIARLHRIKLKDEPTINEMVNQIASLMKEAEVLQTEKGSITIQYLQEEVTRGPGSRGADARVHRGNSGNKNQSDKSTKCAQSISPKLTELVGAKQHFEALSGRLSPVSVSSDCGEPQHALALSL